MKWRNFIDKWIVHSWGMWLFLLLFYIGFLQLSKRKEEEICTLSKRLSTLREERNQLISKNSEIEERIDSENDPKWVEQILMKKLGAVPEGQVKVQFTKKN